MVYAGGRPLFQLSLAAQDLKHGCPRPVLSLSLTKRREMDHLRDTVFRGIGTDEPVIEEDLQRMAGELRMDPGMIVSRQWRKPLRIDEIAQMADTPEVRARPGRP